jgi:NADH dehydrogenase
MNVVTGAFGYIGRHIAALLLEQGETVRTITTHPEKPNPFGPAVNAYPYHFDRPDLLEDNLRGAKALFNTYWVRFDYQGMTFDRALENTRILFESARRAGVGKVVQISVTQSSLDSSLPYYRGKARQEQILFDLGVPYSIVRPTLVFAQGDILVNNIAWLIRRFPMFPVFGDGSYRLQPVFAGDLAQITVEQSRQAQNATVDAAGPETFTFNEFVRLIASKIKPGIRIVRTPPGPGIAAGKIIGRALGDVLLTRAELDGLMMELLTSDEPPRGSTPFSTWLDENHQSLGRAYASEVGRHFTWSLPASET